VSVTFATSLALLAFHAGRDVIAWDTKHYNSNLCPSFILTILSLSLIKQTTTTSIPNPKTPFSISISPLSFSKLIPKLNWVWWQSGTWIGDQFVPIHSSIFPSTFFFWNNKDLFNLQQHHKMRWVAWHKQRNKGIETKTQRQGTNKTNV